MKLLVVCSLLLCLLVSTQAKALPDLEPISLAERCQSFVMKYGCMQECLSRGCDRSHVEPLPGTMCKCVCE
ncbi:hypothetical protein PMAYCL1PPCAC_14177, partial [Pristionchus mayeri]